MINRRSLRVKAFKNLFALESSKNANNLLARDRLEQKFSPDLNSMEVVDKDELQRKKDLALAAFDKHLAGNGITNNSGHEDVDNAVIEAFDFIKDQNHNDYRNLFKNLGNEAERVSTDHFTVLSLLEELAFQNKKLADQKMSLSGLLGEKARVSTNLFQNRILDKIRKNEPFQKQKLALKISWGNREDLLRDWYKGVLNKDAQYKDYLKKESPDYDADWMIVDYICRGVIFKNEDFTAFFEDIDLDWSENMPIVRSLVLKTIKSMKNPADDLHPAEISYNWDDDLVYVKELFERTVRENEYIEELLKEKLLNWEIERVALTDKVLLKMAIAEMIYFPSIPTKVTINEFIEISKTFSTPKSKKFLNGILDGLSIDLKNKGVIKKSGRGLLDNK